jgi:hypothetical protein
VPTLNDKIFVQFVLRRVSGEVCVNGIPVFSVPEDPGETDHTLPINALVVSGLNQVELVLDIEGTPSTCRQRRKKKADPEAAALIRVLRFPGGQTVMPMPSPNSIVAFREWYGEKDESEEAPRTVSLAFDAGAGFGQWSWQAAPPLVLDPPTIEEARVLCDTVRSAIRRGDTAELLRLGEVRFREVGQAFGATSDDEDIAQLERWIAQYAAEPDRVLEIDPRTFDFRLVAGDKLLLPLNKDWSQAVRMRQAITDQDNRPAGDFVVSYGMMLARIGGKLSIVR